MIMTNATTASTAPNGPSYCHRPTETKPARHTRYTKTGTSLRVGIKSHSVANVTSWVSMLELNLPYSRPLSNKKKARRGGPRGAFLCNRMVSDPSFPSAEDQNGETDQCKHTLPFIHGSLLSVDPCPQTVAPERSSAQQCRLSSVPPRSALPVGVDDVDRLVASAGSRGELQEAPARMRLQEVCSCEPPTSSCNPPFIYIPLYPLAGVLSIGQMNSVISPGRRSARRPWRLRDQYGRYGGRSPRRSRGGRS